MIVIVMPGESEKQIEKLTNWFKDKGGERE